MGGARGGTVSAAGFGAAVITVECSAIRTHHSSDMVVEGECDKLLPPGWAAEIAGQIPGGRSIVIPKAGHCPQIEKPSVVNHVLVDFLTEVQRKVSA